MSDHNHQLCELLKRRVCLRGRLLALWHSDVSYRQLWCRQAGVELSVAEALVPPSEPGVIRKAVNFTAATVRHIANGGRELTPAQAAARIAVCESNTCGQFQADKRTCRHVACGCYVDVKAKWASEDCPLGLWPSLEAPPTKPPRHPLPKHVTRWAVGITSAPRPVPTLHRCVESVMAAGFAPTVFAEPGTSIDGIGCPVAVRTTRRGIWRNYVDTLRQLLAAHPDAQAIMVLQDDVVLCQGVREFLEHDLWPGLSPGMVSIYSPEEREAGGLPGVDRRTSGVIGLCAAIYPRHVAERLAQSQFAHDWRGVHAQGAHEPDPLKKKAIDTGVCETLKAWGLPVYHYRPSLAQHIADVSSIGHGGRHQTRGNGLLYRSSKHFVGEDVSAFGVYAKHPPFCRYDLPQGHQRYRELPEPMPERPVTVVLPGYGCEDLTVRCLDALNAHAADVANEIVYVDNGSPAGTVEAVESHGSRIPLRIIRNAENRGFSTACNQGIEAADRNSHVLLLNSDAFVGSECVQRLRWHAERHAQVAAVGPITGDDGNQSIKRDENRRASKYRGDVNADRYEVGTAAKLKRQYAVPREVLSGFCILLTRPAIDRFGLLRADGALQSGLGSDDEWCLRAHRAGWLNLVVYNAWCAHLHRSTFKRHGIDRAQLQRAAVRQLQTEGVL